MITLKYNRASEAETKQCFETLSVRLGMDKPAVLELMANPIATANADAWLVELSKEVQVYTEWLPDIWVTRGQQITHLGVVYNVIQSHQTQFEPQTVPALFRPAPVTFPGENYPRWKQPIDSEDAYKIDERVTWNGEDWESDINANVSEPGVSQWTSLTNPPQGLPGWVQPTGSGDSYALNAEVSHNGNNWRSDYANNVWEPGVFGWTQIS